MFLTTGIVGSTISAAMAAGCAVDHCRSRKTQVEAAGRREREGPTLVGWESELERCAGKAWVIREEQSDIDVLGRPLAAPMLRPTWRDRQEEAFRRCRDPRTCDTRQHVIGDLGEPLKPAAGQKDAIGRSRELPETWQPLRHLKTTSPWRGLARRAASTSTW